MTTKKNPAAVALGRKGGKAKVPKGFSSMTPEQITAAQLKSAATRVKNRLAKAKMKLSGLSTMPGY